MNEMEEFEKDVEDNKRQGTARAGYYKLQNGENKVVIMTNPIGFSEAYGMGMVYEGCGYSGSRKYKCYVKDLRDGKIKIMNISYTVAQKLVALKQAARTQFSSFPMPYVVNLKSDKAGTKEVTTETLAEEDYTVTPEDMAEVESYDPILTVIEALKTYQKKKVDADPSLLKTYLAKKKKEGEEKAKARMRDSNIQGEDIQIQEEDDEAAGDIPF